MNACAFIISVVSLCFMVLWLGVWLFNRPAFNIHYLKVVGDVEHNSATTLRANLSGRLSGTFYTININAVQALVDQVPWVRSAEVRRTFPNSLLIRLQEQKPVAYWRSSRQTQLLNNYGEIFDVNLDEVNSSHLPTFVASDDQSKKVLAMYQEIRPLLQKDGFSITQLNLDKLGFWTITLNNSGQIVLGQEGYDHHPIDTLKYFLKTLPVVTSHYGRNLDDFQFADLRYSKGYALRLHGITTKTKVAITS